MASIIKNRSDDLGLNELWKDWKQAPEDRKAREEINSRMESARKQYEIANRAAKNLQRKISDGHVDLMLMFEGVHVADLEKTIDDILGQKTPLVKEAEYNHVTWDAEKINLRAWVKTTVLGRLLSFNTTRKQVEEYAKTLGKHVSQLTSGDLIPIVIGALNDSVDTALASFFFRKTDKSDVYRDIEKNQKHIERGLGFFGKDLKIHILGQDDGYAVNGLKLLPWLESGWGLVRPDPKFLYDDLAHLRKIGLAGINLMYNADNGLMTKEHGLTEAGVRAVKECFRLGMDVDLAHMKPLPRDQVALIAEELGMVDHLCLSHGGIVEQMVGMGKDQAWSEGRNPDLKFLERYLPLGMRFGLIPARHFAGAPEKGKVLLLDQAKFFRDKVLPIKGAGEQVFTSSDHPGLEQKSKIKGFDTYAGWQSNMRGLYEKILGSSAAEAIMYGNLRRDTAMKFARFRQ